MIRYIFLFPLSKLWSLIYRFRRFLYNYGIFERVDFRIPVITVGNLTFGGSGKTPITLWIANLINENLKKPMILTRGYKGKLEKKSGILICGDKITGDPEEYGDEPILLSKRIKKGTIVVGKDRVSNFLFHFPKEKPDVVILDDGFQHLKINGMLNIVVFDLSLPLSKYRTAPLGYMREGFSSITDADIIVFNRADSSTRYKVSYLTNKIKPFISNHTKIAEIDYRSKGIVRMDREYKDQAESSGKGFDCICVSGIARPESFYTMIERVGGKILKKISFPDHHNYNLEEINHILELAENQNAIIVTTEKDIVKLRRIISSNLIYFLPIDLNFIKGENHIRDAIQKCLKTH